MNLRNIAVTSCDWRRNWSVSEIFKLRTRAIGAFWLLLDQGLFALSNFVINVMFARWLNPTDYGWFIMSFSECLFISIIHYSVILEPLLVQSSKVSPSRQRAYVKALFRAHVLLFGVVVLIAAACFRLTVLFSGQINVGWVMVSGLVGGLAMLTLITGRRLCLVFVSARASALIGAMYLIGSVISGFILHQYATVTWLSIWIIIGGWSLFGSILTFWLAYRAQPEGEPYPLVDVFRFARQYVHWGLLASVFGWARFEGLFMILAHASGLAEVAQTRAVINLGNPLMQINMAIQTSVLVWFSRDRGNGSKRNVIGMVGAHVLALAIIVPLSMHYAGWLVGLVYDGRYVQGAWQLPLFCAFLLLNSLDAIISNVFKATTMLWQGYTSQIVNGTIAVLLGLVLIPIQHTLIYTALIAAVFGLVVSFTLRMRTRL
jgi:O-antigen/teichoic acid export membrane protein